MRDCTRCISYSDDKANLDRCCLVEAQAMRRDERHIATLLDAFKVNYFQQLLELFITSKTSDAGEFYGKRCFFYVEEAQQKKVG